MDSRRSNRAASDSLRSSPSRDARAMLATKRDFCKHLSCIVSSPSRASRAALSRGRPSGTVGRPCGSEPYAGRGGKARRTRNSCASTSSLRRGSLSERRWPRRFSCTSNCRRAESCALRSRHAAAIRCRERRAGAGTTGRRGDVLEDLRHRRGATLLVLHQFGLRKARLEIACKPRHLLPNHDRHDALVAQRDEDTTERALAGGVANFFRGPAAERSISEHGRDSIHSGENLRRGGEVITCTLEERLLRRERDAEIRRQAVAGAIGQRKVCNIEQEGCDVGVPLELLSLRRSLAQPPGAADVDVKRAFGRLAREPWHRLQALHQRVASRLEDRAALAHDILRPIQRRHCGGLAH